MRTGFEGRRALETTATSWTADFEIQCVGELTVTPAPPDPHRMTEERYIALVGFFNADARLRAWQAGRHYNNPPYRQEEADALFKAKADATKEVYRVFQGAINEG